MKIILFIIITSFCFADKYYVEINNVTKEQVSSYSVVTDEELTPVPYERTRIETSQKDYESVGHPTDWKLNWSEYLNKNVAVIDVKIAERISAIQREKDIENKLLEIAERELSK